MGPVRQGSVTANGLPRKVSNEPKFVSVAFLTDAMPYLCSRIKVVTQYEGGEEGQSRYQWSKANDGENWLPIRKTSANADETGQHYAYYTTADELGCQLKCTCTPVRSDGKLGPPVESKIVTVQWPPHLGVAVVNKLVETVAATRITCLIRYAFFLQRQFFVKKWHPGLPTLAGLASVSSRILMLSSHQFQGPKYNFL